MSIRSIKYCNLFSKSIINKAYTRTPKILTFSTGASISTEQFKSEPSSAKFRGNGFDDSILIDNHQDFAFGTADFTLEGWYYFTASSIDTYFWEFRNAGTQAVPSIFLDSTGIKYYVSGAYKISTTTIPTLNTWFHLAVSRTSGTTKMFYNGTQIGSVADTTNYVIPTGSIYVSKWWGATNSGIMPGYIDEIRITKGLGRYTTSFTPQSNLINDQNTVLLCHFSGNNGDKILVDNAI